MRRGLSTLLSIKTTLCQVPSVRRAVDDRHHDRRRDERGQDVITAVPRRAVRMRVSDVEGPESIDRGGQVTLAARPGLDQRDPGGGMRHKDVQQPVTKTAAEVGHRVSQIGNQL